jgi:hypothetical protein
MSELLPLTAVALGSLTYCRFEKRLNKNQPINIQYSNLNS